VVDALPVRARPLCHELRRGASEAPPGVLALGKRGRVAGCFAVLKYRVQDESCRFRVPYDWPGAASPQPPGPPRPPGPLEVPRWVASTPPAGWGLRGAVAGGHRRPGGGGTHAAITGGRWPLLVEEVLAAGGEERLPRRRWAGKAARWSFGSTKLQRVQGRVRDALVGIGQRDPASGLCCGQLVLEDVCGLLLWPRVADPLASKEHRVLFHPRIGLFACRAGQPLEAVEVLISPSRSLGLAVGVPVGGRALELEARFARPLCHRDLVRAQQVSQLQNVGRPVAARRRSVMLLPFCRRGPLLPNILAKIPVLAGVAVSSAGGALSTDVEAGTNSSVT
jgi:hypothetical protein